MTDRPKPIMNGRDVRDRIAGIFAAAAQGDDEVAHTKEDELFRDLLWSIARGKTDDSPSYLAGLAIKSRKLDFPRWCA